MVSNNPTIAGCAASSAVSRSRSTRRGVLVRRLKPVDPVPGNTLVTTIDARLQKILDRNLRAELAVRGKQLGHRLAGAAVAIDPATGGILAMSSYPTYNPNDFGHADQRAQIQRIHQRSVTAALQSRDRRRLADRFDVQDGDRLPGRSRAA